MNAAVTPPTELRRLFDRLAAKAPEIRATTAEQRADKLRKLLKATLDARPAILYFFFNDIVMT